MGEQLLQDLEEAPDRFAAEVDELTESELVRRPADGEWNLKELAGHMRDVERAAFLERLTLILQQDNPTVPLFDEQEAARTSNAGTQPIGDTLAEWKSYREQTVAMLRGLPPEEQSKPATHPELGRITPASLAGHFANHDSLHLEQALRLKGLSRDPSS